MLNKTLFKISSLLRGHEISYMVIGGYAVLYHGEPRFTEDIDIVLGIDTDQLTELIEITKKDFIIRVDSPEAFVNQTNVLPLQDKHSNVKVDLIFSFIEFERKAIESAEVVKIKGNELRIVRAGDLIIYKLLAGRPKDIDDAKSVLQFNIDKIDLKETTKKAKELSKMMGNNQIFMRWEEIKQQSE